VTTDVAVIGGGIVGAATAAFLAAGGARAVLFERSQIAAAASGRNSGVIQHPFDADLVGLYRRSIELYRDLAAELPESFRLAVEPAGLMLVGPAEAGPVARRLVAEWATAYPDTGPELLADAALTDLEPALAGGLVACRLAIGFPVAPGSATRAFVVLAERLGARVVTGAEAALAVDGDTAAGVVVDGRLEPAGRVVVAAGPWTSSAIAGEATAESGWPPIRSSWGVVANVGLDRPPGHVLEEIEIEVDIEPSHGRGEASSDGEGFGFSLVTADGASALGSTFLPEPPPESAVLGRLRDQGARYVPAVADAPLISMRTCARPVSPDGRPLIGPIPGLRGAFVAAGNGPWGISTGPGSARLVADLILGRVAAPPPALDPARFGAPPATPGRSA
jgi:D-hydroxyproline dehydrogenase subunit beta